MPENTNSLKESGFTITRLDPKAEADPAKGENQKGDAGWAFKVTGPAPEYFVKRTRGGRLLAYRSKDSKSETTINGFTTFQEDGNGDLVGVKTAAASGAQKLAEESSRTGIPEPAPAGTPA